MSTKLDSVDLPLAPETIGSGQACWLRSPVFGVASCSCWELWLRRSRLASWP